MTPGSVPAHPPGPDVTPPVPNDSNRPDRPSRMWPLVLKFGLPALLLAVVAATAALWPRPATIVSASPTPSTRTSSLATPKDRPTPTVGPATSPGQSASFAGTALQDSANSKTWQVRIAYSGDYGLIDYRLPTGAKACRGVLVRNSDQTWLELITQGTCDDRGTWTLTPTSAGLSGDYRPAKGNYRVHAVLAQSAAPVPVTTTKNVPTDGCTNAPSKPLTTIAVFGDDIIGVYDPPGYNSEAYRGPRSQPSEYARLVGGDDNIDVTFESATSNHAILAISC